MSTRVKTWVLCGVAALAVLLVFFRGELSMLLAGRRPDAEAARLVRALDRANGDTVAEIGSGKGALTVAVARALPASRVYSTELDPERLADTRRAVGRASLKNVEVREAAVDGTNLPDGCCRAIFMRTVYHHFTSPPVMLAALHRSLAPGGRLGIIELQPRGMWRWVPGAEGTPDRGGHGVAIDRLREEVTRSGRFTHVRTVESWAGPLYLMVFERNQR
jgi:ubiquinone/menaquinone biosynthesis C-methylase UbiE